MTVDLRRIISHRRAATLRRGSNAGGTPVPGFACGCGKICCDASCESSSHWEGNTCYDADHNQMASICCSAASGGAQPSGGGANGGSGATSCTAAGNVCTTKTKCNNAPGNVVAGTCGAASQICCDASCESSSHWEGNVCYDADHNQMASICCSGG